MIIFALFVFFFFSFLFYSTDTDVANLVQVINSLELYLSEELKASVERDLYRLLCPEVVIKKLAHDLIKSDSMNEVKHLLFQILFQLLFYKFYSSPLLLFIYYMFCRSLDFSTWS